MGKEKDILERHLLENPEEHKEAMELITGRRWDIDPASFRHYPVHIPRDMGDTLSFLEQDSAMLVVDLATEEELAITCTENQTIADPIMVERLLAHIANQYLTRARDGKKPVPIIAGVLYYGDKPWTAPVSLREKLKIPKTGDSDFILDFRIRVVDLGALPDETIESMTTDLRYFAGLLKAKREGRRYTVNRGEIHHPFWTIKGLAHLSGMEIDDEELLKISGSKEECTMELAYTFLSKEQAEAALRQGFQEGEASGIQKGEKQGFRKGTELGFQKGESEGRKRAHQLFSWLHKQDRISEYPQALSSEQLFEQYWNEMQNSLKN
ncbi:Rpn family recombination-promoting nuclease/putative transposase [uncultured Faecalibaculum sp.]|uniref:Rpn family recombination-promoting nuclease/putative transposase n=1 Tax=uncultured Faecalibaculum sp. TaxID=1729681 RepID=UPI0025CFC99C|nr:Rpn family recombination-promoting nuclease/putative transposase [uncultured Faecalibaculum sp.]